MIKEIDEDNIGSLTCLFRTAVERSNLTSDRITEKNVGLTFDLALMTQTW